MQKIKIFFRTNYKFLLSIMLLLAILFVCIAPERYINATFSGFSVWARIVLPSLFVFFVLTKLFIGIDGSMKIFRPIDKVFSKFYHVNEYGGYVFAMSIIAGYPIGVKLASELCQGGYITQDDAKKIISFASTSGPMFIMGSVASQMFHNYMLGVVIMVSHTLSSLINGMFYTRKRGLNGTKLTPKSTQNARCSINDVVYDSIVSSLMVGGYIAFCFAMVEMLGNAILPIKSVLPASDFMTVMCSALKGIIEVTTGCINLTRLSIDCKLLCVILTGLITFGGLSIHLQSGLFLNKIKVKYKYFLLTKLTQTIIAILISSVLCFILL